MPNLRQNLLHPNTSPLTDKFDDGLELSLDELSKKQGSCDNLLAKKHFYFWIHVAIIKSFLRTANNLPETRGPLLIPTSLSVSVSRMNTIVYLLFVAAATVLQSNAFQLNTAHHLSTPPSSYSSRLYQQSDDNQAEIAELEERLRQLKSTMETPPPQLDVQPNGITQIVEDDEGALDGESEDSIMFSERWKESDPSNAEEGEMGGAMKAALALGLVVFLAAFSQVPVGEGDLQRYQDIKGSSSRIDLGDINPDAP
ncbi:predicted protein [Thalassiosira pseudonana CCMP1335]|uniref:Uncharacterized protein n=1 Tax=Thalassiosira pseudonana TaxID=35128 RepID=B5YLR4_THAPS|nr:predicted protein [Thalassiosira pseudonana CCMP1335]ACI64123.1 predicted protein [Thalassiosira pseudonana CCMP1335]